MENIFGHLQKDPIFLAKDVPKSPGANLAPRASGYRSGFWTKSHQSSWGRLLPKRSNPNLQNQRLLILGIFEKISKIPELTDTRPVYLGPGLSPFKALQK